MVVSIIFVGFLAWFGFIALVDSFNVHAAPELDHPKMTCDFIYYHDDEQDILRRCYDEQKEVICYISEDFKSISCMPAR
jgi:hypothetical protein